MDISTVYEGSQSTVSLSGQLDTNTAPQLSEELDRVFEKTYDVVLDFQNLDYLSSAGLRVLVAALKKISAASGSMKILNTCEDVHDVFEITGLVDVFDIE